MIIFSGFVLAKFSTSTTFKIPFIEEALFASSLVGMIVCLSVTGIVFLLNIGLFKELPGVFTSKAQADGVVAIASVAMIAYSVFALMNDMIFMDILLIFSIALFSSSSVANTH